MSENANIALARRLLAAFEAGDASSAVDPLGVAPASRDGRASRLTRTTRSLRTTCGRLVSAVRDDCIQANAEARPAARRPSWRRSDAWEAASRGSRTPRLYVIMIAAVAPPGWSAFDPQRVDELRRSAKSADAPCPFNGHDSHRLPWRSGGYRAGSEFHGDPPVSFRVSPTYVLEQQRDNFIVAHELLGQLGGKAETWRLGNENSEDALSFNVFRSLQEAGALGEAAQLLAGADVTTEPELIVWGRRLGRASTYPVPELQAALTMLETWPG